MVFNASFNNISVTNVYRGGHIFKKINMTVVNIANNFSNYNI